MERLVGLLRIWLDYALKCEQMDNVNLLDIRLVPYCHSP